MLVFLHDMCSTWLLDILPAFTKGAIILAIGWFLAGKINNLIVRTGARLKWDPVISEYVANTFRYIAIAIFLIVTLRIMGFPVTSFLATLGVSGIIIGMGLRGELSNYFAGLMMLGARPFGKGDLIEFGPPPQIGIVRDVHMMYTVLDGADNVR
ncbi:mechanosensitive ion channel family protein, partial [Thermodesulfobacteriota bacterium]